MLAARSHVATRLPMAFRAGLRTNLPPGPSTSTSVRRMAQSAFTKTRSATKPTTSFTFSAHTYYSSPLRTRTLFQRLRSSVRFFHKSKARRDGSSSSPIQEAEPKSLGARMRTLSREYGWSALGVYLALSALDFPFCYLLVRYLGTDLIGEWEHRIVSVIQRMIPDSVKQTWHEWTAAAKDAEEGITGSDQVTEHVEMAGWGVEEATERNKRDASLATQLALAYAIHKTFIFVRVPLTAAVTPKVVKILRGWGWDIGKRTTKEAKALKRATNPPPKAKRR